MTEPQQLRLISIGILFYRMPLKRPYGTARGTTTESVNFIFQVNAVGRSFRLSGVGECQPRHALTGDGGKDRIAAWGFACAAADLLQGRTLEFYDRASALAEVRRVKKDVEHLALQHSDDTNKDKPYRGTLLGIEVALLDLVSRASKLKISELLGSTRSDVRISVSTISSRNSLEEIPDKVLKQSRFPMTRVKGTGDLQYNLLLLDTVAQANQALGRAKPLWIDINEAFDYATATQFVSEVASRMNSKWLPQELVIEGMLQKADFVRLAELQALADSITGKYRSNAVADLRVMPDEGLWDVEDLLRINRAGGCGAINIKAPKAGGLLSSLDLASAAVTANPDTRISIGGMVGTSDVTAWALHNLARSLPRLDYLTTVPPGNVKARIARPLARYAERGSNLIAAQEELGLGAELRLDAISPFIERRYETSRANFAFNEAATRKSGQQRAWAVERLAEITGGRWLNAPHEKLTIRRIGLAAANARPGRLVVAMEPEHWGKKPREGAKQLGVDASEMAYLVAQAGGSALLTNRPVRHSELPILMVSNTHEAVWQLAATARREYDGPVVGITGTVGKSTTKSMLKHVLSPTSRVVATPGNWNTAYSLPVTVANLVSRPDYAIVEAAISGFIRFPDRTTAELVQPTCAVVTAIGTAHLDIAPTLEATADYKGRLLDWIRPGGTAVINSDAPYVERLITRAEKRGSEVITFGEEAGADFRLLEWALFGEECRVRASILGKETEYILSALGKGMALNSLATLATVVMLGLDANDAIGHLETYSPGRRVLDRSRIRVAGGEAILIDDTKNAADLSMEAAVELLGKYEPTGSGRRLAVLGHIVNLGGRAEEVHAQLVGPLVRARVDRVLTVGLGMEALRASLPSEMRGPHSGSPEEAVATLRDELRAGDVVLVKGSHRDTGFRNVSDMLRLGQLPPP